MKREKNICECCLAKGLVHCCVREFINLNLCEYVQNSTVSQLVKYNWRKENLSIGFISEKIEKLENSQKIFFSLDPEKEFDLNEKVFKKIL